MPTNQLQLKNPEDTSIPVIAICPPKIKDDEHIPIRADNALIDTELAYQLHEQSSMVKQKYDLVSKKEDDQEL